MNTHGYRTPGALRRLAWIVGVLITTLGPARAAELSVPSTTASSGQTVTLEVALSSIPPAVGLQFDLQFDSAKLSVGAPVTGEIALQHVLKWNDLGSNSKRLLIYSLETKALASGTLLRIPFTVRAGVPDGPVSIGLANVILADAQGVKVLPVVAVPGAIVIGAFSPPRLSGLVWGVGGVTFELSGGVGLRYLIEVSDDLQAWSNLGLQTLLGNTITITDPAAVSLEQRFYRAKLQP